MVNLSSSYTGRSTALQANKFICAPLVWGSRTAAIFLFFLLPLSVQAASPSDVVINEIAWMGTDVSFSDEWIELYNNTNSPIKLGGWVLKGTDGTPEINLAGTILANKFYLLERTNDETVPIIEADLIYKGSLSNEGEYLKLITASGEITDTVNCFPGWFAGDNKTKQTMERKSPQASGDSSENWQISKIPGGTPRVKNSSGAETERKTMIKSLENRLTETKTEKESAPADEQTLEEPFSFLPLLIAFVTAIFSGTTILILKKKLKIS